MKCPTASLDCLTGENQSSCTLVAELIANLIAGEPSLAWPFFRHLAETAPTDFADRVGRDAAKSVINESSRIAAHLTLDMLEDIGMTYNHTMRR